MFTGIVQSTGKIFTLNNQEITIRDISDSNFLNDISLGMSIAVNGVCLTVISFDASSFSCEMMPETLKKTNLQSLGKEDIVNLEKAMSAQGRFEGHMVQGHVDAVGTIQSIETDGNSSIFTISFPPELGKYIVAKGSVCLNGISLTVIDVTHDTFSVGIIPHTMEVTMLHRAREGDKVNIEVDVLAKYIEKMMNSRV